MKEFLMSFYKEKIPPIKPTFWQKCLIILDKETEAFSSFFMYVVAFTTISGLIMDMCSSSPFKLLNIAFYWTLCFVVNFLFGFAIAIIVDGEANKITNSSKGKIISLIKNHMTEPVLNEILLKVSLIDLYSLDYDSILDLKIFNQCINQIENKIITYKAIDTVSNWMLNPVLIDE